MTLRTSCSRSWRAGTDTFGLNLPTRPRAVSILSTGLAAATDDEEEAEDKGVEGKEAEANAEMAAAGAELAMPPKPCPAGRTPLCCMRSCLSRSISSSRRFFSRSLSSFSFFSRSASCSPTHKTKTKF